MKIRLSDGTTGSKEAAKVLTKGCKDCESQFRRDVLIDRLVTDSLQVKFIVKLVFMFGAVIKVFKKTSFFCTGGPRYSRF